MKLRLLLALMILPFILNAKEYNYSQINIFYQGSDNITMDKNAVSKKTGKIKIEGNTLRIDGRTYRLKKCKNSDVYKANGMLFKFVYNGNNLSYVNVLKYDNTYTYIISENELNDKIVTVP